jgi:DnaK suppressor protein
MDEAEMKPVAEAKVRARLMSLRASLESHGDSEAPTSVKRSRLGEMQYQPGQAGDEGRRLDDIKRVEAALARLDDNKYGYCSSCGSPVEDRRLEADPAVALCGKCGGAQQ